MKKYFFYLLFISFGSIGQVKNLYPDEASKFITADQVQNDLLYKRIFIEPKAFGNKKGIDWEFASNSEFEEIAIKKINILQSTENKEYYTYVKVICHDYKRVNEKYFFDLELIYTNVGKNYKFKINKLEKFATY